MENGLKFLPRRKSKIFVSYRREDSGGHSGRLYADLTRHYGRKQVFRDIDAIKAGEEFEDVIDRGREIFSAQLNDYLRPHKFSQNVTVISGDSIDFVVGQGSDNQIWGDSTGFQVQIAKVR